MRTIKLHLKVHLCIPVTETIDGHFWSISLSINITFIAYSSNCNYQVGGIKVCVERCHDISNHQVSIKFALNFVFCTLLPKPLYGVFGLLLCLLESNLLHICLIRITKQPPLKCANKGVMIQIIIKVHNRK